LHKRQVLSSLSQNALPVRPYFDCFIFLLLPTIVNLSSVSQLNLSRITVSFIFALLLLKNVFVYSAISASWQARVNDAFRATFHRTNTTLFLLFLLIAFLLVSELRGFFTGTTPFTASVGFFLWAVSLLGYLLSVASLNSNDESRRMLFVALILGLGIFVLTNVIGYYAGIRGFNTLDTVGQNKMLSLVGLNVSRVALPFSTGVNNFGAMAGLGMVSGFFLLLRGRGLALKSAGFITFLLGALGMVLVDSRASLGISIFTCMVVLVATKSKQVAWSIRALPYAVLIAPFAILALAGAIADTEFAQLIVRDGAFAKRLGVLTARDVVWTSAFDILSTPSLIHLVGYGAIGQFTSGATLEYSWVFGQIAGLTATSLHNANLQIIFDIGYTGFVVWLLFWLSLMSVISVGLIRKGDSLESSVMAGIAVFVSLIGIFEVGGTLYFPDMFAIVLFLVVWTLPQKVDPGISQKRKLVASASIPKSLSIASRRM